LHHTVAIVFACIFYGIIRRQTTLPLPAKLAVIAFIFVTSLIRGVTWAFLFVPFFLIDFLKCDDYSLSRLFGTLLQMAVLLIGAYWVFQQVSLPESNIMSAVTGNNSEFFTRVQDNLVTFTAGRSLEMGQRFQIVFFVMISVPLAILCLWKAISAQHAPVHSKALEAVFHLSNLGLILAATIIFYRLNGWRDYRVLAPHLFLSFLLLIQFRRYWLVALVIAVNVLMFPKFREIYPEADFHHSQIEIADFRSSIEPHLVFEAEQTSAWCNTLLLYSSSVLGPVFTAVPPGIGISVVRENETVGFPLRSSYVFLDEATYNQWAEGLNVELLTITSIGTLYHNRDAECG
jgi:hypothetical protein